MEGLKFEYKGELYDVPRFPGEEGAYWMLSEGRCQYRSRCKKACYNSFGGIYGGCVYGQLNAEARKAFYNQCFRAEKSEETEEKSCEECANYKPKEESEKLPKLTQEVFNREDCPEWARYAVLNSLGVCYFCFNRPRRTDLGWSYIGRCFFLNTIRFDASDWENSVIEKPYFSGYKILTETNFVALEHSVNELMKQGWIPRGGAVKDDYSYMQTMVKR